MCGIEIDSGLEWTLLRSKLTCFLCEGQIDFVFLCGPKLLGGNVWVEIDLVFVCRQTGKLLVSSSIDLFFYGWSKLA